MKEGSELNTKINQENNTTLHQENKTKLQSSHPGSDLNSNVKMQNLFDKLLDVAAKSNFLKPSEVAFHESTNLQFKASIQRQKAKVDALILKVLDHLAENPDKNLRDIHYQEVSDAVDSCLEKADVHMDVLSGKIKKQIAVQESTKIVKHATQLSKPQLKFKDTIDNFNSPFVPKLRSKPNAKRPLDFDHLESNNISDEMVEHLKSIHSMNIGHPYEYEIANISYPSKMLNIAPEILYETMEKTPFTWIDTENQLEKLASILDSAEAIAIDTEHHDLRTFQGITCLIQISTRKEDYVIDALALRHHLQILNSSFTNPEIVKVFHGADSDIQWLQRDFGLYIVNLFDTYHASHVLGLQGHGLAFLLKHYCNVVTDKRFQRADWRIRPIPMDMLFYARSDTHYLLYIYDRMRNDLIDKSEKETLNLMNIVLSRSAATSSKVYKKEIYDAENGDGPNGWKTMLRKFTRSLRAEQLAVYRALHAWRDQKARDADESVHYVLPNHMLFNLVEMLPINPQQTLACCSPIPNFVRMFASEMTSIIDNARQEALRNMKAKEEELKKLKADLEAKDREFSKRKLEGPIHIRYDSFDDNIDFDVLPSPTAHLNKKVKTRVRVRFVDTSNLLGDCLKDAGAPSLFRKAMDLKEHMKLEVTPLLQQSLIEPHVFNDKPDIALDDLVDDVSQKAEPMDSSPKLQTNVIFVGNEQINVVANIAKEDLKRKKRKRSKKRIKSNADTDDGVKLKDKSIIALELEKMQEYDD